MPIIRKAPVSINIEHNLCSGCGHGITLRIIQEVLDELGYSDNQICCVGVGCSCTGQNALNIDHLQCAHGRAPSVATGMKRTKPETVIWTYQGDGDACVIGMADTLNTAYRNENVTQIILNNNTFAMTGGQMSWCTLADQVTITSKTGRDCHKTGLPFHLPELVAYTRGFDVAYSARAAIIDAQTINQAKKMLHRAFEAQINREGYSVVEILSPCPTNWHMNPTKCLEFIKNEVLKEYPIGEFRVRAKGDE